MRIESTLLAVLCALLFGSCRGAPPVIPTATLPVQVPDHKAGSQEPFVITPSGLKHRILRLSEGRKPQPGDTVTVHYRGWLDDGTQFDNSHERGQPESFQLSKVISGWTEGLQLIGVGGKIELVVPPDLGYGQRGSLPDIPPDATLHFVIELINIENAP